jgi:hypothetical protein
VRGLRCSGVWTGAKGSQGIEKFCGALRREGFAQFEGLATAARTEGRHWSATQASRWEGALLQARTAQGRGRSSREHRAPTFLGNVGRAMCLRDLRGWRGWRALRDLQSGRGVR